MAFDRPLRFACVSCAARALSDLAALDDAAGSVLDRVKARRTLAPGEALFRQGDPYGALYCVAEGLIGRRMLHPNGAGLLASVARPGDLLGECGLFGEGVHAATAEALTPAAVCVIQGSDARRLAAARPELRERLFARCLGALAEAERARLEAAALPALARLCKLLLSFADPPVARDAAGPAVIWLPVTRADLAALLGVQPESLSRLLRRAATEGLVTLEGRRVIAPSVERLIAASETGRRGAEVE